MSKRSGSPLASRRFWWGVAGAMAAAAAVYYLRHRDTVDFFARLFFAQRIAGRFYARYASVARNIPYGPNPTQRLDVYRPESQEGCPVFVYVHGGSWNSGNKELYSLVAERLLPFGFVVTVIGYTLFPYARYWQQTMDVALAISWVLENIQHYGGDPKKVIVCSQSAGAHLAALALYDAQWLATTGHHVSEIAGFIGISGVYDIEAQAEYGRAIGFTEAYLARVMGGAQNFARVSPINYVRPGLPPALLIHGDADTTVPIEIAEVFHDALLETGNDSRLLVYPNGGHAEIMFGAMDQNPAQLVTDMVYFVKTCEPVK